MNFGIMKNHLLIIFAYRAVSVTRRLMRRTLIKYLNSVLVLESGYSLVILILYLNI